MEDGHTFATLKCKSAPTTLSNKLGNINAQYELSFFMVANNNAIAR